MIRTFLDCSTAHVSPVAQEWLNKHALWNANQTQSFGSSHHVATHAFGWWLHIPTASGSIPNDFPDDLKAVAEYARNYGCNYILFDRSGEMINGIPIFM